MIYSISITAWIAEAAKYFIFVLILLFLGFLRRKFLKAGVEVLLSVLKIKATDYDDDPTMDKINLLLISGGFAAVLISAAIMLTGLGISTIDYIYEIKHTDMWVSGEAVIIESEDLYASRGYSYVGKRVCLKVNSIELHILRGNQIDDESFEKLVNSKKVSILYAEIDGINEVVQIYVEE